MMNMATTHASIQWRGNADGVLVLLDQTRLPAEIVFLECQTAEDVWQAIQRLSVRGAPAIGIAAAYGVYLGVRSGRTVDDTCAYLATSRPTAANLFWALERMRRVSTADKENSLAELLLIEAAAIDAEDRAACAAIGRHGTDLLADLPVGAGILTHCNAGALVSGSGPGTALAVVFELAQRGQRPQLWVDETRPLLQGARLTMWELAQRGIDATLICDSAAAQVMREGRVQVVITGADRIAANGDVANKIGTYGVALLARAHGIPFYVAAPASTFDLAARTGAEIPIEERAAEEITHGFGRQTAPDAARVYNPAFDVTPGELIAAIITERGIFRPIDAKKIDAKKIAGDT
jgi:methylthioribose-1-phosphate isomerase